MSRPLHRGVSGQLRPSVSSHDPWDDTQTKDRTAKEDVDRTYPFTAGTAKSQYKFTLLLLKFSLVIILILVLTGSFWWRMPITNSSRGQRFNGYRRLQEHVVSDLIDIGKLNIDNAVLKDVEYCSQESENFVPCYNVTIGLSGGEEFDRRCIHRLRQNCLVLPPVNYKIPLRWPTGKDAIWFANVKITAQEVLSSGSLTKRMMMLDEEQISFRPASLMYDGVEDYTHQIAEMIGLRNESNFIEAGVQTILDIGCGYGSFGAHLFSSQLLTMCIANYEASGSQVQLTLERGLPAMIGSFNSKQLPYPSLSFDLIHSRNNLDWDKKGSLDPALLFATRAMMLKPHTIGRFSLALEELRAGDGFLSGEGQYGHLRLGLRSEDLAEDSNNWNSAVHNYWSLLSPLIFSDHPKRPGNEDPSPPYNMLRNVLDMNARFGGFNAALLEAGKSVWVMNVVPTSSPNHLPLIVDRGFVAVLHDWCEPFPSYPRTYDLVHAEGLLWLDFIQQRRCEMLNLFIEIDRLLRPEGWVILRDASHLIESARAFATHLKWDARIAETESDSDKKLLICQKPFHRRQAS